jgi:lysophospholipase L1-like esterase
MRKRLKKSRKAIGRSMVHLAIAAVSVSGGGYARAQTHPSNPTTATAEDPYPARLAKEIKQSVEAFIDADREHAPAPGGIVFVGSSTIRFWDTLNEQFSHLPIVRRGYGGSRMSDLAHYYDVLVTPEKPKMVVVYAGDNDLVEGATPQEVMKNFKTVVEGIRKKLPDTRIAFVSIKPSPCRPQIMDATRETNAMALSYVNSMQNMDYINVFDAMLGPDGKPRHELFKGDDLHMNAKGYEIWKNVIAPHLERMQPKTSEATSAPDRTHVATTR